MSATDDDDVYGGDDAWGKKGNLFCTEIFCFMVLCVFMKTVFDAELGFVASDGFCVWNSRWSTVMRSRCNPSVNRRGRERYWGRESMLCERAYVCVGSYVIVISRFLKRYLKAKSTRAPAYSRALHQIRGVVQTIVRERLRSGHRNRYVRISQRGCPEDSAW